VRAEKVFHENEPDPVLLTLVPDSNALLAEVLNMAIDRDRRSEAWSCWIICDRSSSNVNILALNALASRADLKLLRSTAVLLTVRVLPHGTDLGRVVPKV
jgi:hypothetical protein